MTDDWIDTAELPDDAQPGPVLAEALLALIDGHGTCEQWARIMARVETVEPRARFDWETTLRVIVRATPHAYKSTATGCDVCGAPRLATRHATRGRTHRIQLRYTPDGDAECAVCTKPLGLITEVVFAWGRELTPADDTF